MDIRVLAPIGDWTGEGAVWQDSAHAVFWVDINRFLIHRYDWHERSVRTWQFDQPVTALGLTTREDTLVVALASHVVLWQPGNDSQVEFCRPEPNALEVRLNDGRPDPAGNFWVGSMINNVGPQGQPLDIARDDAGSLYRISPDGSVTTFESGIGISNTLCWTGDARIFYFGDTLTNTISAYDFDVASGEISNKRVHFGGFDRGLPDGSAIDAEGYLWNARYGGGCVVRVSPDGKVDRVVEMPAENITTCTFGGPELTTLIVTSAANGDQSSQMAGALFAVEVGVPGIAENKFAIE